MDLITADHVRDLEASGSGAALVLIEGQARVLSRVEDADGYLVINREDLRGLMYAGAEPRSYEDIARSLNSAVVELGG